MSHKKKKFFATSVIVTPLVLFGAVTASTGGTEAYAAPTSLSNSYKANSDAQVYKISKKLGLSVDEVRQELRTGKLAPEILKQYNINVSQLKRFG
jgi:hypothetical protein